MAGEERGQHLQLHLEPAQSIEIQDLTAALGSLARQYQTFIKDNDLAGKGEAKLLVSAVSRGSIDILFDPTVTVAAGMTAMPLILEKIELVEKFAKHIKKLLDFFGNKTAQPPREITVKDCDDAINIVKPIAQNGGTQNFTTINGPVSFTVVHVDKQQAEKIITQAATHRAQLALPQADVRQRVAMVWSRLDRDMFKPEAATTPDRGTIEEVDPKAKPVFFTDEMAFLKNEMISDEENPYQKVYFVDVEVVRVSEKVVSYRVIGFHGKEPLSLE